MPAVTLTQSGFRVVAGRYVRLSGTVAGAQPGVSVTVLAQTFGTGAFAQVGTVLTGGGGSWSFLAQPRVATTYAASVNGSTSSPVTIGVQPGDDADADHEGPLLDARHRRDQLRRQARQAPAPVGRPAGSP